MREHRICYRVAGRDKGGEFWLCSCGLRMDTDLQVNRHWEEVENLDAARKFLRGWFRPIEWNYDRLTPQEQAVCSRERFERLMVWAEVP